MVRQYIIHPDCNKFKDALIRDKDYKKIFLMSTIRYGNLKYNHYLESK